MASDKGIVAFFADGQDLFSPGTLFRQLLERALQQDELFPIIIPANEPPIRSVSRLIDGHYQMAIFSLENSPRYAALEHIGRLFPGLVLLHDASFDALFLSRHRESTSTAALSEELSMRFGHSEQTLANSFIRGWGSQGLPQQGVWKSELSERGNPLIVSSRALLCQFPQAEYCPLPIELGEPTVARADVRRLLGISDEEFIFAYAPRNGIADRETLIQDVVSELSRQGKRVRLLRLIADDCPPFPSALLPIEISYSVSTSSALAEALIAVDAFIGLRVSEFSGIPLAPLFSLAAGLPTLVSLTASGKEIPSSAALHIRPGRGEAEELSAALLEILQNVILRESLSARGRETIRKTHDPAASLTRFTTIVQENRRGLLAAGERRRTECERARENLLRSRANLLTSALTNAAGDVFFRTAADFNRP